MSGAYDDDDDDEHTSVTSRAELMKMLAQRKCHRPCVLVVSGRAAVGKLFKLEGETIVGRGGSAEIRLDEDGISRHHAKFVVREDGSVEIVDLRSTNGTFVNGDRFERIVLRDGDKVQMGGATILKFSYQDELEEALQKNLYESATRDALTGASNKRAFTEALARELAAARRHRRPLSLVMFDIDFFKKVNDTYGHPAGDHVLQTLASVVMNTIRTEDIFARYGGEEFALLMRDTPARNAVMAAERIRTCIERTVFAVQAGRIPVTVSMGVATADALDVGSEALIEEADRNLYEAKRSGRNRVCAGALTAGDVPALQ